VRRRAAAAAVALGVLAPAAARAQDVEETPPAPVDWHGWFAAGGTLPIGGPSPGVWTGAGISRNDWGLRAELFVFDPGNDDARLGFAAASLGYELGRTKRHIVLTAHFGGGVRFPEVAPIGTLGLHTQLGLQKDGPLVLGADLAVHVDMGQLPLDVYLVSTLSVGLAF
jgi:hypothetical protein